MTALAAVLEFWKLTKPAMVALAAVLVSRKLTMPLTLVMLALPAVLV